MKVKGQLHFLAAVPFGNKSGPNRIEGWLGHRTGLDGFGKEKVFCSYRDWNHGTA
jgi:hypothetical protein